MADSYSIQISSSLIDRLSGYDNNTKKTKKSRTKILEEPKQHDKKKSAPSPQKSNTGGGWPLQPPVFLPVTSTPVPVGPAVNAELEAIRSVLQESENVKEKMEKLEANMVQELTMRAKELHDKEFKLPYQNPLPCTVEREACLNCYKEHVRDPLKCAQMVKNFADCARMERQKFSSNVN